MSTLTIRDHMSRFPFFVPRNATIAEAHRMLRENGIRHLLVMDGDRLAGIVTDRDLHLIETLRGVNPDEVAVEEAMTPDPLTMRCDTPIEEAALAMTARKIGSVVATDEGKVVGVFTTIDALRALVTLLHDRRTAKAPARRPAARRVRKPAPRRAAAAKRPAAKRRPAPASKRATRARARRPSARRR